MQYFIHNAAQLRQLGHAFETQPATRACLVGPDGRSGLTCSRHECAGYFPDRQTWKRLSDGVWIGWETGQPPTPEDLARPEQLAGDWITLGDGQAWLVPTAYDWDGSTMPPHLLTTLPTAVVRDSEGWRQGDVLPRYRALWEVSLAYARRFISLMADEAGDEVIQVAVQADQAYDLIAAALGTNYYLGPGECSELGLFTTEREQMRKLVFTVLRLDHLFDQLEEKKKTWSNGDDSPAGATATTKGPPPSAN